MRLVSFITYYRLFQIKMEKNDIKSVQIKMRRDHEKGEFGYRLSYCEPAEQMGHTTQSRGGPVSREQWLPTTKLQASP